MEFTKKELHLILNLVGNHVRELDEAIRGSENATEEPIALKERLEEAEEVYRKIFHEIY